MFHVNAWGIPYSAAPTGCKLVLPGRALDGKSIHALVEAEGVTPLLACPLRGKFCSRICTSISCGSRNCGRQFGLSASHDRSVPEAWCQWFHAWGMTERNPLGTVCTLKERHVTLSPEQRNAVRQKQGWVIFGIDMKIVDDASQGERRVGQFDRDREHFHVSNRPNHDLVKWDERPVLTVVKKLEAGLDKKALFLFYRGNLMKWQIPDDFFFVDSVSIGVNGRSSRKVPKGLQ